MITDHWVHGDLQCRSTWSTICFFSSRLSEINAHDWRETKKKKHGLRLTFLYCIMPHKNLKNACIIAYWAYIIFQTFIGSYVSITNKMKSYIIHQHWNSRIIHEHTLSVNTHCLFSFFFSYNKTKLPLSFRKKLLLNCNIQANFLQQRVDSRAVCGIGQWLLIEWILYMYVCGRAWAVLIKELDDEHNWLVRNQSNQMSNIPHKKCSRVFSGLMHSSLRRTTHEHTYLICGFGRTAAPRFRGPAYGLYRSSIFPCRERRNC